MVVIELTKRFHLLTYESFAHCFIPFIGVYSCGNYIDLWTKKSISFYIRKWSLRSRSYNAKVEMDREPMAISHYSTKLHANQKRNRRLALSSDYLVDHHHLQLKNNFPSITFWQGGGGVKKKAIIIKATGKLRKAKYNRKCNRNDPMYIRNLFT